MIAVLLAWIGDRDLDAAKPDAKGLGSIATVLEARAFDHVVLLADRPEKAKPYVAWLRKRSAARIQQRVVELSSPTNFAQIYPAARDAVTDARKAHGARAKLAFHLSSGTPAMAAVWLILGKMESGIELLEASKEAGVKTVHFPFDLAAEFIPAAVQRVEASLEKLSTGSRSAAPEFSDILHRSETMQRLVARAEETARFALPVLILGESGTGKELVARATHRASARAAGPFVAVNCGAIPRELVESEFFGHRKGSFSGATADRKGHFEEANKGTLFLDEVGELPLDAQVRLLRALQEKKVTRVGDSHERQIDVRIIAATNRDLQREVAAGRFREDLFYRLAILTLKIPALREREGDLSFLLDALLDRISTEIGAGAKKISPGARKLLLQHTWPGNVRELEGTLSRAYVWSPGTRIEADAVREALFVRPAESSDAILGRSLGNGLDLKAVLAEVVRHYLPRALAEANDNRPRAAELVGLKSYQVLNQWLARYEVKIE
jgi:transcriptional regulator with PAS, ATPase and Fis domain